MKKIFLMNDINDSIIEKFTRELSSLFTIVIDKEDSSEYEYDQFIIDPLFSKRVLFINDEYNIYCADISLIPKKKHNYFLIGNIRDISIVANIVYFYKNLEGIFLHNVSVFSSMVTVNQDIYDIKNQIHTKNYLSETYNKENGVLVVNDILAPSKLEVTDSLYTLYQIFTKCLDKENEGNYIQGVYFNDFILSLIPIKYWMNSLFFLKSKLQLKISSFFHVYDEVISLHIPVARSKYLRDLFESLLQQTNQKFKIFMGVDGYNDKQKKSIVKILEKYKDKFVDFDYFINRKNLGVGRTRRKLLHGDKNSRYIMFLDDDNFLSTNAVDFLYKKIEKYQNMGMYCISNIDVRFDINYKDYIDNKVSSEQPNVYTNRERVNRIPLYCNQEETPLTHDRFYSDVMDIKYNKVFDNCSIDMVFNRFLEIICGNINLEGACQYMRIGHQYHQTRERGYDIKQFLYVMYILDAIAECNNNNYYHTHLIKTLIPKQNQLFT